MAETFIKVVISTLKGGITVLILVDRMSKETCRAIGFVVDTHIYLEWFKKPIVQVELRTPSMLKIQTYRISVTMPFFHFQRFIIKDSQLLCYILPTGFNVKFLLPATQGFLPRQ